MSKSKMILFLLLLFSCQDKNRCKFSIEKINDYKVLYPSYSEDTACSSELLSLGKQKVYISFSNTWNDSVIVKKDGKVVFCGSIVTNRAAGITFKGFVLKQGSDKIESITVYLIERRIAFNVNISYTYKYIKIYKVSDEILEEQDVENIIRVKSTNCDNPIY